MLWRHITVREVNKYLSEVVDELTAKHGNVTSTEFEAELESRTGIGWKQVKNYRNHPSPDQILRPNSKIKAFIYQSRRKSFIRNLRSRRTWIKVVAAMAILGATYYFGIQPLLQPRMAVVPEVKKVEPAPEILSETKSDYKPVLKFMLPGFGLPLRLGKFTELKGIKWDKGYSQSGQFRRQDFVKGTKQTWFMVRVTYNLDNDDITAIEIQAIGPSLTTDLKEQIEKQTASGFTQNKEGHNWDGQFEYLSAVTEYNPLARADRQQSLVVSLTSKFH